jgi:hypothetical protein
MGPSMHSGSGNKLDNSDHSELGDHVGSWIRVFFVNTSGKAGAQIPHLPLGDDSYPRGR